MIENKAEQIVPSNSSRTQSSFQDGNDGFVSLVSRCHHLKRERKFQLPAPGSVCPLKWIHNPRVDFIPVRTSILLVDYFLYGSLRKKTRSEDRGELSEGSEFFFSSVGRSYRM